MDIDIKQNNEKDCCGLDVGVPTIVINSIPVAIPV